MRRGADLFEDEDGDEGSSGHVDEDDTLARFRGVVGSCLLHAAQRAAPGEVAAALAPGPPALRDVRRGCRYILDFFVDRGAAPSAQACAMIASQRKQFVPKPSRESELRL